MKKGLLALICLTIPILIVSCGVLTGNKTNGKRWILVYNASNGNVQPMPSGNAYQIVMNDVDTGSAFTIRPDREVMPASPDDLISKWSPSEQDSFSKNPPNAVLAIAMSGNSKHKMHYFKLSNAAYNPATKALTLQVQPLMGTGGVGLESTGPFNQAVLVVDGIIWTGG